MITALKDNHNPGCIIRNMVSGLREVILPLCSDKTSPGVLHSTLVATAKEIQMPIRVGPEEDYKDDWRVGAAPLLRERELWLFSPEKKKL